MYTPYSRAFRKLEISYRLFELLRTLSIHSATGPAEVHWNEYMYVLGELASADQCVS